MADCVEIAQGYRWPDAVIKAIWPTTKRREREKERESIEMTDEMAITLQQ